MKPYIRLLIILALLASLRPATAQVTFAPVTSYPVGSTPYSIVAADVNGDGKVDLISANEGDSTLTVLTNSGNGIFSSNATYHTFANPESVVAADVNRDGKVDLICACTGGNALMTFTNSGSGGFVNSAHYTIGSSPYWVIAVDVNGDGNVDLISGNNSSLVILTNDGTGNFAIASSPGVGSQSVTAADLNGDGKIDLIEANANSLRILTNGGNGTFSLCYTNTLSTLKPGFIATADVNDNGKVSVVVPDYGSGSGKTLTVLTNDGSGNFSSNTTYTVGNGPYYVIAADANGDGKVDLICANRLGGGTLTVLTNNGSGDFGSNATYTVGANTISVTAADLNGDGKLDLITAFNTLSVLLNTSIFPPPNSTPSLNIKPSGNGVLVLWPSASAGWSLQQNPDLTTMNWSPSGYNGYAIVDDGTNKSLIITPPIENAFFRLLHP
jgi:FG-GAP-like repeat/EF hand